MRTCIIASPVATQSGYGHHAREVVTNIIEQKGEEWDIKLLSMPWGSTPMSFPLSKEIASRLIPLPIQQQPDIWVQISVPNEFQTVGKYNIGITAVTEGDICPKEWIECINRMQKKQLKQIIYLLQLLLKLFLNILMILFIVNQKQLFLY
jgi:hypothetical protein